MKTETIVVLLGHLDHVTAKHLMRKLSFHIKMKLTELKTWGQVRICITFTYHDLLLNMVQILSYIVLIYHQRGWTKQQTTFFIKNVYWYLDLHSTCLVYTCTWQYFRISILTSYSFFICIFLKFSYFISTINMNAYIHVYLCIYLFECLCCDG